MYSPVHLRPAATIIPTSDVQMTSHWPDKPGQEDSPQPQSSVAGHPSYQVSTVLQTGTRAGTATGEPSSLPLRRHPPGLWSFPQGSQCGGPVAPDGSNPQRSILLGLSTRHLSCLVCIWLPEPRLLPQPRAVRLDKNNLEEGGEPSEAALQGHGVG